MSCSRAMQWSLAFSAVSLAQLLLVTGILLLPQWRLQQSARQGMVIFSVAADGSVRLWNRPIDAAAVPSLLQRAERLSPATRVRVVPAPDVPWGVVQDFVSRFDQTTLDVELQLPETASF